MHSRSIRYLAVIIAALLCYGAVAGCSTGEGTTTTDKTSSSETTATTSGGANGSFQLPIVDEPLTITSWVSMDSKIAATLKSFDEMAAYQELFRRTGITIDFIHPAIGQETDTFNLMVASGDYPDMIEYSWANYPGGPGKALEDNAIIPLNDLVDQHAPNFKAFMDNEKEYTRQITTDDNQLYAFVEAYPNNVDGTLNRGRLVWGFQVRKDWLEETDLELPTTIDEWYAMLKAFKTNHPEAVPLTVRKSLDNYGLNTLMCAWGITYDFYNDEGSIKYGPAQPEYKEYLSTMAKWYEEGLIDPDFPLNDGTAVDAKVLSDKAGSWVGLLMGAMGKYLQNKEDAGQPFDVSGTIFPKDPETDKSYNFILKDISYIGSAITSTNEHPVETVKLLDYMFTDEGRTLMTYGIEGETYTMENDLPTYTDLVLKNPDGLSIDVAIAHYTRGSASSTLFVNDPWCYEQRTVFDQQQKAVLLWGASSDSRKIPPVTPAGDESERLANLLNPIKTYADEMFVKFVMGQEPLENFDEYVANLENMSLDEAINLKQEAMTRYLNR